MSVAANVDREWCLGETKGVCKWICMKTAGNCQYFPHGGCGCSDAYYWGGKTTAIMAGKTLPNSGDINWG